MNQGKNKREKDKRTKIRQQCCLIQYGELFELLPECFVLLVCFGFLCRCGIVFDEPCEVFGVVDFVAEHLFAASGVMYQLVSFFVCYTEATFKKRYKLKKRGVWKKSKRKRNREKTRKKNKKILTIFEYRQYLSPIAA